MKKTISILMNVIMYLVIYVASMLGSGIVLRIFTSSNPDFRSWVLDNQGILMIGTSLIGFLIISLVVKLKKKSLASYCGFKGFSLKGLPLTILAGASLGVFSICIVNTKYVAEAYPAMGTMLKSITEGNIILIAILGPVISGSFIEELLFRGAVLNEIRRGMSNTMALVLHGLLFAVVYSLMAGDLFVGAYAAIGAVIFGLIYIWFNSIWAAITTHIASSTLLLILTRTDITILKGNGAVIAALISLVVLAASLFAIRGMGTKSSQASSVRAEL